MAQVTIDMEAFSFEVPDEKTLIINLDGGGCIRISVESLATLSMVINEVLAAPNQGSSTTDDIDDEEEDDDDGDDDDDDDDTVFDPIEPINSALGSLNVQEADSFEEIETQQLHF